VCRSQADLNSKKPLEKALQKERAFFQRSYPSLASRSGTFYLRKRLATLLSSHIRDCLPDIAMKINVLRRQFQVHLLLCLNSHFKSISINYLRVGKRSKIPLQPSLIFLLNLLAIIR